MSNRLRLSDVLARNVTVEWYEGVALVREVTDRALERSGAQIVPELHQVEIAADGGVLVSGGGLSDEPVRRLGQLLQAAIVQSEPPVQLRLLIEQATAASPAFTSIGEYSAALGYFERPDRAGVLRSLYARAAAAPAPQGAYLTPTLDAVAPLPTVEPWMATEKKSARPATLRVLGVVAGVVLLVVAGTAGYLRFGGDLFKARKVSAVALKASDAVGSAVVSGISAVTDQAGLGRLAPRDPSGTVALPPAVPVETPAPAIVRKPAQVRKPKVAQIVAFDLAHSAAVEGDGTSPAMQKLQAALTTISIGQSSGTVRAPEKLVKRDLAVYSPASAGVVAPVGIRPHLPRELPANVDKSRLGRIELLILPDGKVGSVKLLDHPHNVHEVMFLSAVKAWEFRPATRDGRPVSYRKIVWMAFE